MDFVVSGGGTSVSETQKARLDHHYESEDTNKDDSANSKVGPVSNQLFLKSSSKSLDKQLVLRRIRHRKSLNKVKTAFEALLGTPQSQSQWLQDDAFSAP